MSDQQELRSAVYRFPSRTRPFDERMLILDGNVLDTWEWKFFTSSKMSPSKRKRSKLGTPAAALKEYDARLAAWTSDGWRVVDNWPNNAESYVAGAGAAPLPEPKREKKKAPKPKAVTRLQVSGQVPKVKPAELAPIERAVGPLPAEWVKLLTTHGARMFGRRLRLYKPAKVLKETRQWVTFWTVKHSPVWSNFATLVPDTKRLVLLGSSIDGDVVGCVTGGKYVIFPRGEDEAVGLKRLAEVFGWFLQVSAGAGDTPRATYAPES